ncbi:MULTISPECIES: NAD(P)-dependent oxidoreductase [Rhodococcus]|uniref:NAD(P)-dependent oxidoreductase n=1 Tax=Rhodococcus TaxID=1827 RepID=UPI0022869B6E|nr:NAD(P)-dependent oxidoreductase [Rhodococcus sp. JS3073]WAM11915.1 NAD(P)-dependent oxidoreductase [Rhodococcus sp. JS3073]
MNTAEKNLPTVTFVGIGAIGMPMAHRLVDRGYSVAAVDPNPASRDRAENDGMRSFDDIAATPISDVVLVMVATGQQLLDTVKAGTANRQVDHQIWVICSTVGPRAAQEAAQMLTDAGAAVIDAPVTGGVPGAEAGMLRFLTAGEPAPVEALRDLFGVLGEVALVSERPGDGQATKLVNQLCSSVHLAAAAEAIALSTHLGLDPVKTVDIISGGSGASWFFDERGHRMADLGTVPDVLTRLAILAKDNGLVEAEADEHRAHVPLLKAAKQQYQRAAELGLLESDDSQIIRTYLT